MMLGALPVGIHTAIRNPRPPVGAVVVACCDGTAISPPARPRVPGPVPGSVTVEWVAG